MSALGNKEIMARNIKRYMQKMGISRKDFCERLGFAYSTVTDWLNAEKYPRIDKIEMMANFFGVSKADLVEPSPSPAPAQPVTRGDMLMLTDKREITHIQKYRALDERGKDNVDATLEHEYEYASPEARAEKQSG